MARVRQKKVEITLQPVAWCDALASLLSPLAERDALYGADALRADVESGRVQVFGGFYREKMIGAVALRIDALAGGRELVIMNAAHRVKGGDLTAAVMPYLETVAEAAGCVSMRVHSARKGMGRHLQGYGFNPIETVFRKAVSGGGRRVQ